MEVFSLASAKTTVPNLGHQILSTNATNCWRSYNRCRIHFVCISFTMFHLRPFFAVPNAIREIDDQTNDNPNDEPDPSHVVQHHHQIKIDEDRCTGQPWHNGFCLQNFYLTLCLKILNLYSISECHDVACSDLTEGFGLEGRTYCPVGKIFNGVHVVVMDDVYNVKSIGDPGEVFVGGPTLAIGYLNRPDLNEERFIRTPGSLVDAYGSRLYRTGDWGYLLSDGSLQIIGRCDSMVKIRGYTVELKAVEAAFLSIPEINMSCVLSIGAEGIDKFLVSYVVLNEGYPRSVNNIRSKLKFLLPFYMIPSQFVFLEK